MAGMMKAGISRMQIVSAAYGKPGRRLESISRRMIHKSSRERMAGVRLLFAVRSFRLTGLSHAGQQGIVLRVPDLFRPDFQIKEAFVA